MPLVEEGRVAPAFTLPDQDGAPVALKDLRGRPVVLYFYPKDDTSGCTKQACGFRDTMPDFASSDAMILGVSTDGIASHRRFIDKHGLPFTLLADEPPVADGDPLVSSRYGVWQEKSMYGRRYMGVVRTTYLIDAQGRVARRWDKVKVPGHAEAVLEAVQSL